MSASYCKPGLKSIAREVTGPKADPTVLDLLNGHVVKAPPKCLCLPKDLYGSQHWPEKLLFAPDNSQHRDSKVFLMSYRST